MGLRELVNSTAETMSLPAALNALRNGEIEAPTRDLPIISALVSPAALPVKRAPQPPQPEWQRYLDEQHAAVQAQSEIDARELQVRMRARQENVNG